MNFQNQSQFQGKSQGAGQSQQRRSHSQIQSQWKKHFKYQDKYNNHFPHQYQHLHKHLHKYQDFCKQKQKFRIELQRLPTQMSNNQHQYSSTNLHHIQPKFNYNQNHALSTNKFNSFCREQFRQQIPQGHQDHYHYQQQQDTELGIGLGQNYTFAQAVFSSCKKMNKRQSQHQLQHNIQKPLRKNQNKQLDFIKQKYSNLNKDKVYQYKSEIESNQKQNYQKTNQNQRDLIDINMRKYIQIQYHNQLNRKRDAYRSNNEEKSNNNRKDQSRREFGNNHKNNNNSDNNSDISLSFDSNQNLSESESAILCKQISLSDNDNDNEYQDKGDFAKKLYEQKCMKEEIFSKLSEQAKTILKLQQKLYYYENLCKRLLKQDEKNKQIYKRASQKLKQQESKLRKAEMQIQKHEQKIRKLKAFQKSQKQNLNTKPQKDKKCQIQRRPISIKQEDKTALNLNLNQNANVNLNQNANLNTNLNKLVLDYRSKNQNLTKMNKILQIQICEANSKIISLQSQIQNFTHKQYEDHIKRLKDMSSKGKSQQAIQLQFQQRERESKIELNQSNKYVDNTKYQKPEYNHNHSKIIQANTLISADSQDQDPHFNRNNPIRYQFTSTFRG